MTLLRRDLLLIAVLCALLIACNAQSSVGENIRKQLQSSATRIDAKSVATAFSWDEMFVFAPYTPKDEMCKKVGVTPTLCSKAKLRDVDEGEFLLVFMHGGAITHVEGFPRTIANFDESERCAAKPINRDRAIFKVERQSGFLLVCE